MLCKGRLGERAYQASLALEYRLLGVFLVIRFFLVIFPHSGIVRNLIRQLGHAADGWGVHRQVDTAVERKELQPHPGFF